MRWEAREEEWRDALVNLHILFWSWIVLSRFFFSFALIWMSFCFFLPLTPIIEHILISEFIATSGLGFFFPQSLRDSHLLSGKGNFRVQKDKKLAPNREQFEIDTSLTLAARWPITLSNDTIESLNPPHRKSTSFWLWMRGDVNKSIPKTVKTNGTTNQMGEMNVWWCLACGYLLSYSKLFSNQWKQVRELGQPSLVYFQILRWGSQRQIDR